MITSQHVPELERITQALNISYDPHSNNETRQNALVFLDGIRARPEAAQYGYLIANDPTQQIPIRQFGLSLIESAIQYQWHGRSLEEKATVVSWVTSLAIQVTAQDTAYYRNKIAWLWVQLAKRELAATWFDMDQMLLALWETSDTDQVSVKGILVLEILETLSEDICVRDDVMAMLRQEELGQALNEVMVTEDVYNAHLETRGSAHRVRYSQQGWFVIMCDVLRQQAHDGQEKVLVALAGRILRALRPTVTWINLECIVQAQCIESILSVITRSDAQTQIDAIECLHDIVRRPFIQHLEDLWNSTLRCAFTPQALDVLRQCYVAAEGSAQDIDDAKYTLQKKLAEVLSIMGDALAQQPNLVQDVSLLTPYFELIFHIATSQSLSVSIPILHCLCKIYDHKRRVLTRTLDAAVGTLLELCSQRLIRYEYLPTGLEPDTVLYLHEDFETLPEQHAFLGNYRRYCNAIIAHISASRPREALQHVLTQAMKVLREAANLDGTNYIKSALPVLQLEAQAGVVKSCLAGFLSYVAKSRNKSRLEDANDGHEETFEGVADDLEQWCKLLMSVKTTHPDIARLSIQLLVEVASKVQNISMAFVQQLMQYLMTLRIDAKSNELKYMEAVKAFNVAWLFDMQRLASAYPDFLHAMYGELEIMIQQSLKDREDDVKLQWGLQAILVVLVHRSSAVSDTERVPRLRAMTQAIPNAWQAQELVSGLASFSDFMTLLGLEDIAKQLELSPYPPQSAWSNTALGSAGREIQAKSDRRLSALPLRMTLAILGATSDWQPQETQVKASAIQLWEPLVPHILPHLIRLLDLATGFADPANWTSLPQEQQSIVQMMFVDRSWQSGISSESKDDFEARVHRSGDTLEGFASTIRGAPRQVRDSCYHIIHSLTRFDVFFSLDDLPVALANALLGKAQYLSLHHLHRLIRLVDRLVSRCPAKRRRTFLPPVLSLALRQVDARTSAEWTRVQSAQSAETSSADEVEGLDEEMKAESVVRKTTTSMVMLVAKLLEPDRPPSSARHGNGDSGTLPRSSQAEDPISVRELMLTDSTILAPLVLSCTNMLQVPDTRCCGTISQVLSSIVPRFGSSASPEGPASDPAVSAARAQICHFICNNILRTAITSLNDARFVDCQDKLAGLIASIVTHFASMTPDVRDVLYSLPSMQAERVDMAIKRLLSGPERSSERRARAVVLELLDGVRGVSIAEAGKLDMMAGGAQTLLFSAGGAARRQSVKRPKVWASGPGDMDVENANGRRRDEQSPELDGIADMFGNT